MTSAAPQPVRLEDYAPPPYLVDEVDLSVDIQDAHTLVHARLTMRTNSESSGDSPLQLDGHGLETRAVVLDGQELREGTDYRIEDGQSLIVTRPVGASFVLETVCAIDPANNTALEGFYAAGPIWCTQCEAQGFRRITWYPDRPDVMARFTVSLEADAARFPVLLSNGNPHGEAESLPGGRHRMRWHDPHPKPCYLFAMVAGDLACVEDSFVTRSGRLVALRFFVEHGNEDQVSYAMQALKNAMLWDERAYGFEVDLNTYSVVAVGSFNMGAMENKGLNIFNTSCVLARTDQATDGDFLYVEKVIGHEYFHNWTGNRITCRDWFQLSLKEGLTVFRDQQFSAAMNSPAVERIKEARMLRVRQFAEDEGPTSHPVRPNQYMAIDNFYTATVYEKGAEVVRMLHTMLGEAGFRRGMDLYVRRHDGQAVRCEDFLAAMADANDQDLSAFMGWYTQSGTPRLEATGIYDATARRFTLTLRQSSAPTPGQPDKHPLPIPVRMGLLGPDGRDLPARLEGEKEEGQTSRVLLITQPEQSFTFTDIPAPPVPSLLRGFSAPVRLTYPWSEEELTFLMKHDSDPFSRWDAGQVLAIRLLLTMTDTHAHGGPMEVPGHFIAAFARILEDESLDPAFAATALSLPGEMELGQQQRVVLVDSLHAARTMLRRHLAETLRDSFQRRWSQLAAQSDPQALDGAHIGQRALQNLCLSYLGLVEDDDIQAQVVSQALHAANMTDVMAAMAILADGQNPKRDEVFSAFHQKWGHAPLVVDKWFSLQATSSRSDTVGQVRELMKHADFSMKVPNRVYALLGGFAKNNQLQFNSANGQGYALVGDAIIELDQLNPIVAARMATAFGRWRSFDATRQNLMRQQMERILAQPRLSPNTLEIITKTLEAPETR
ncbi:MAG: aminopeptidase N [Alphaproteobacteria bacterium]|nr:MAG: aminopeptidase N [Alphaproteobacteria bacterium]